MIIMEISKYTLAVIREHKKLKNPTKIWRLMPIVKRWIGCPKIQYCVMWGNTVLAHFDTQREAILKRREIYNLA